MNGMRVLKFLLCPGVFFSAFISSYAVADSGFGASGPRVITLDSISSPVSNNFTVSGTAACRVEEKVGAMPQVPVVTVLDSNSDSNNCTLVSFDPVNGGSWTASCDCPSTNGLTSNITVKATMICNDVDGLPYDQQESISAVCDNSNSEGQG